MANIIRLPITSWKYACSAAEQERALYALEGGNVLLFPQLRFSVQQNENRLLSPAIAGDGKNISLNPAKGTLRGSDVDETHRTLLRNMMLRFALYTRTLLQNLLPHYEAGLQQARTSYRPLEIAGRSSSWRKDDTRLHVDSFPSSPIQGKRILRVFTNINPHGQPRTWRLGESFDDIARRYLPTLPQPIWGANYALQLFGLTKSRRSAYDHFMLQLHDRMKADAAYQSQVSQTVHDFPPGSSWMVFTDQVSHAAMSGQYALEQTYYLPVDSMLDSSQAPLRVLERLLGRTLT
ncbi:MAG: Kdo hydroxylase family protein [Gammaproteobacteria bacterium]|nr:Kdo hydroxylase family protein [Gammaproteobacteria bacterium]